MSSKEVWMQIMVTPMLFLHQVTEKETKERDTKILQAPKEPTSLPSPFNLLFKGGRAAEGSQAVHLLGCPWVMHACEPP